VDALDNLAVGVIDELQDLAGNRRLTCDAAADHQLLDSRLVTDAEQMRNVEIFVQVGPMDTEASADALPVSALLVSRPGQAWELR
jgi:hypothetical protein